MGRSRIWTASVTNRKDAKSAKYARTQFNYESQRTLRSLRLCGSLIEPALLPARHLHGYMHYLADLAPCGGIARAERAVRVAGNDAVAGQIEHRRVEVVGRMHIGEAERARRRLRLAIADNWHTEVLCRYSWS